MRSKLSSLHYTVDFIRRIAQVHDHMFNSKLWISSSLRLGIITGLSYVNSKVNILRLPNSRISKDADTSRCLSEVSITFLPLKTIETCSASKYLTSVITTTSSSLTEDPNLNLIKARTLRERSSPLFSHLPIPFHRSPARKHGGSLHVCGDV